MESWDNIDKHDHAIYASSAVSYPACTFTQLEGADGILCAGGNGGTGETK